MRAVQRHLLGRLRLTCHRLEDLLPDSTPARAIEAMVIVHRRMCAILRRRYRLRRPSALASESIACQGNASPWTTAQRTQGMPCGMTCRIHMAWSACGCQFEASYCQSKINTGLPFQRKGLQRERPMRPTDQDVCAGADACRYAAARANLVAGKRAVRYPVGRCKHRPRHGSRLPLLLDQGPIA
jgi:hypothetical protein